MPCRLAQRIAEPALAALCTARLATGQRQQFMARAEQPGNWVALWHSVYTSGLGTLLSLLLGGLFAFASALTDIRMKQLWVFLFMLPMMIPPQVTALSWLQLFGPGSILLNSLGLASRVWQRQSALLGRRDRAPAWYSARAAGISGAAHAVAIVAERAY